MDTFFKQSRKNSARPFSSEKIQIIPGQEYHSNFSEHGAKKKEIVSKQFINSELVDYIPNPTRNNTNKKVVILTKRIHKNEESRL